MSGDRSATGTSSAAQTTSFGQMLRRLRTERAMSQNALARSAGLDPSYVNRMERAGQQSSGGRAIDAWKPGRQPVLAIAEVLELSYAERDRFLFCAGLAPEIDWQQRCEDVEAALETVRETVGVLETVRTAVGDLEVLEEPPFIRRRTG